MFPGELMFPDEPNIASGPIGRAFALAGRVVVWGILCAFWGVLLGFINGVIHVPPAVSGEPLEHEWYPLGVLLIMVVECVAGFLLGAGVAAGVQPSSRGRKVLALGLGGAFLGLGLGWVLARVFQVVLIHANDSSELVSDLFLQAIGAFGGMVFGATRQEAGLKPTPVGCFGEADEA